MEERGKLAGNTATGLLKLLALAFMFVDHAGKMLFPGVMEMRIIGRIAFPLYCWCLVVGVSCTRSVPKYMLRLLLVGLASQPLYMLALDHTWREPNIFLTLLVALGGLWALKAKKWGSPIWGPVLALVLADVLGCDYGWRGVMLCLLLYGVRDSSSGIAAVMVAFCLYWGSGSGTVVSLMGVRLDPPGLLRPILTPWLRLQALAILALPLMIMPMRSRWRIPTWLGYGLYPAHLALLYLLERLL